MPLSWNEIRHNAHAFATEWADETSEDAEAKSFWDAFFAVFGVKRRTVASFEEPVKNLAGNWAYIDLFWPGTLLVEHKSRGKSLDKANTQAMEYIHGLKNAGRDEEIPRYIIVSDFARLALHDLEDNTSLTFELGDLHKQVNALAFIPGYKQHKLDAEDPINIKAVELLGDLHDALEAGGYTGHDLERFLVRILFCLFADDTGIFERNAFALYLQNHTKEDGSDLGMHLSRFFDVLDKKPENRQKKLVEELADLPHVNGELFREKLEFADFDRAMRDQLMRCARFDWSRISPAVFGSLFQSVMQPKERRQEGAHYTSERDILKVVRSQFLDDLRAEFEKIKTNKNRLKEFHEKLGSLRFLDPACGCGNFLVVTYRELRLLELDVLKSLYGGGQQVFDIHKLTFVDVDAMFGIEINEFPARIAEVAMWLVDHQMNQMLSAAFGLYFVRLPLVKSATIKNANAMRIDWKEVLAPDNCSYVLGNPPFVGHAYQSDEQKADQRIVLKDIQAQGVLDYVCNWYVKAAEYIEGTLIRVAFVSTNSITQGEQAGLLWNHLFRRFKITIHFGHRTFAWQSEARGKAHVHVVIIGFGLEQISGKKIYDYDSNPEIPLVVAAKNISPYLIEGPDTALVPRTRPISQVPKMSWGNKPTDGGHFILSPAERAEFLRQEPASAKYIHRYMSGGDFINGIERYCLWLVDADPKDLRSLPMVMDRVAKVKKSRLESKAPSTREYAKRPTLFRQIAQPDSDYMAIPEVSSERRQYIPIAFLSKDVICSNKIQFIPSATNYLFGVLTSAMHMAWTKQVGGRLKSDPSYSNTLVYNNYPFPEKPTEKQKAAVETKARSVLDTRSAYPDSSLADLYDPLTMPAKLSKAHAELDRAVDACYRSQPFASDRARVEFLFEMYLKLDTPLTATPSGRKRKPSRSEQSP